MKSPIRKRKLPLIMALVMLLAAFTQLPAVYANTWGNLSSDTSEIEKIHENGYVKFTIPFPEEEKEGFPSRKTFLILSSKQGCP